ncbi:MAG: T9SS type A sorting domain-containing protein [Bacteroidales bacterium]|nr:T9SS type A sorting domain-containing protein [Bacteroidales bacterium]
MKFKISGTLFILLFPMLLFSQNNFFEKDSITELLLGKWTWEYSYGGIGGITITPEIVGYDRSLLFEYDTSGLNSDSLKYHSFINDTIIRFGKTKIRKDSIVYPDTIIYFYRIYEDLLNITDQFIYDVNFIQDSLILFEYCVDCFWHYFKKDTTLSITPYFQKADIIEVDIFPNPAKHILNIQISNENQSYLDMEVISSTGQVKKKINFKHEIEQINISDLQKGIYFLRIKSKEFTSIEKIIIL